MRVKSLAQEDAQEHHTMSPARPRIQIAGSGGERSSCEDTAPPRETAALSPLILIHSLVKQQRWNMKVYSSTYTSSQRTNRSITARTMGHYRAWHFYLPVLHSVVLTHTPGWRRRLYASEEHGTAVRPLHLLHMHLQTGHIKLGKTFWIMVQWSLRDHHNTCRQGILLLPVTIFDYNSFQAFFV